MQDLGTKAFKACRWLVRAVLYVICAYVFILMMPD